MAQNIGEVTVKVVPELDQAAYERLFKLGPDATWEFPPSTVHLSPESIDALATAIAAKLDGKVAAAIDGAANAIAQG